MQTLPSSIEARQGSKTPQSLYYGAAFVSKKHSVAVINQQMMHAVHALLECAHQQVHHSSMGLKVKTLHTGN
jgi:hypothetical protein